MNKQFKFFIGLGLILLAGRARADEAYKPAPTLAEEIKTTKVPLVDGYAQKHPRLLFGPDDVAGLKKKAEANAEMWNSVLASARRLGAAVPEPDVIKAGKTYWRVESIQSGALAYIVTGAKPHLDRATQWMLAYCKQDVWGTGFRDNLDLPASWYLYHVAIAYDLLYNDLAEADRKAIRDGLAAHAKAIYDSLDPARKDPFTYDQNHMYIPTVALAAGSLALLGDVPEAADWLQRAYAIMQRCRFVLGDDGWYFEGPGYWAYALHWHARYADLMGRATGRNFYDLPALKNSWRFALHISLPGPPTVFDLADTDWWKNDTRGNAQPVNYTWLWGVASAMKVGESRTAGDMLWAKNPDRDYPAAAFLWFDPAAPQVAIEKIKPHHYFEDHGFVAWRSGWGADDTACLLRLGPPEGHSAVAKSALLKDWRMNAGHVHADIGSFWMYAKGTYLASGTGYTAEKWTRDQNTILVSGVGQAMDGAYHNERGYPPEKLDRCRIDNVFLSDQYAFASGEYGEAYPEAKVGKVGLRRTVAMSKRWLLVIDDLSADREHKLTWICHSDGEFKKDDKASAIVARAEKAAGALAVIPLTIPGAVALDDQMEASTVVGGTAPGAGKPSTRGYQLTRTMTQAAKTQRLAHLLVPLGANEQPPTVQSQPADGRNLILTITWPGGKTETVTLDGTWTVGGKAAKTAAEPVGIVRK